MALFSNVITLTTIDQLISDLHDFSLSNGWSIDFFGVYNGQNRLHIHKGTNHFEVWYQAATAIYLAGCTGYDSGSAPTAQPGVSGTKSVTSLVVDSTYAFVSCGTTLYLGFKTLGDTGIWGWLPLGEVVAIDKKGTWTGGQLVGGRATSGAVIYSMTWPQTGSTGASGQMIYNGSWTPLSTGAVAGAVVGSSSEEELLSKQPILYNGGLLPVRVTLWIRNAVTTLLHPVGYAPGIYRVNGGDIYKHMQILDIGGAEHLIVPANATLLGSATFHDLLFAMS